MDGSRVLPGFEDFDDRNVYNIGKDYILKANALSFALEFDSDKALFASNLDRDAIGQLLQATPKPTKTRWINLWCPEQQKGTVEALATHYGFSPRTLGLMISDPYKPALVPMENRHSRLRARIHRLKLDRQSFESHAADVEMSPTYDQPASHTVGLDLNHYRIVNEVWYYCSVDWGSKCEKSVREMVL